MSEDDCVCDGIFDSEILLGERIKICALSFVDFDVYMKRNLTEHERWFI